MGVFTETDRQAVIQAKLDKALGKRVVSMTVAGKQMEFDRMSVSDMDFLLQQIEQDLASAAPAPSYILTRTSKGL